jgi:hypothetical protein
VVLVDLMVIAPMFRVVFLDFMIALPKLTQWMFVLSVATRKGGWAVIAVLPVVAGFIAGLMPAASAISIGEWRRRRSRLGMLTVIALSVIVLLNVVALFLPMLKLIEVTGGK